MIFINIVLVTYHSSVKAAKCIDGYIDLILAGGSENVAWTVVDNSENSEDASYLLTRLPSDAPNFTVVSQPENPGFASACNRGAKEVDSEWTVFLNPDLTVSKVHLDAMLAELGSEGAQNDLVAYTMRTNGRLHQGVELNRFGWFKDRDPAGGARCLGPSGGAGAYRTRVFVELGGFAEDLFAWGEDADFALRAAGLGIGCVTSAILFEHEGGHSFKDDPSLRRRKAELLLANRFTIAKAHYGVALLIRFYLFALVVVALKAPLLVRDGTLLASLKAVTVSVRPNPKPLRVSP